MHLYLKLFASVQYFTNSLYPILNPCTKYENVYGKQLSNVFCEKYEGTTPSGKIFPEKYKSLSVIEYCAPVLYCSSKVVQVAWK